MRGRESRGTPWRLASGKLLVCNCAMDVPVLTLREALKYEPETGLFTWRERPVHHFKNDTRWSASQAQKRWNTRYAGNQAFLQENKVSGYLTGVIDGQRLLAHRVAWAISVGSPPLSTIDHRNGARHDNRLCNLREATRSEQSRNCSASKSGTSSFLGVSYRSERRMWRAVIFVDGKQNYLGSFADEIDAARAYDAAAALHYGNFARLNFPSIPPH